MKPPKNIETLPHVDKLFKYFLGKYGKEFNLDSTPISKEDTERLNEAHLVCKEADADIYGILDHIKKG